MAVSLKWRKLYELEKFKFCENEPSDTQFFLGILNKNMLISFKIPIAFGLSGVTLTPPAKNLVEVRNSKVLQIFVSLCFL
jgi:hypothetical protein